LIDFILSSHDLGTIVEENVTLAPLWKILLKLEKPFECIMKAWYYLPPTFKKMACLSLIDPYPFDGHPLKVGMVFGVS
jgi:hypothetical protein